MDGMFGENEKCLLRPQESLKAIVRRIAPLMARFGVDVVKHNCDVRRGRCLAEDAWWTKQLNYCLDLCL